MTRLNYHEAVGRRYADWTVEELLRGGNMRPKLRCRCVCGTVAVVDAHSVVSGRSRRCKSCARKSCTVTHGATRDRRPTPEWRSWTGMIERCGNPRHKHYRHYGGRGIRVCERWLGSFENFLEDMGPKPSPKHSIERRDNDGNYEPSNCMWATHAEQCRNRRSTRFVELNGRRMCLRDAARLLGLSDSSLHERLARGTAGKLGVVEVRDGKVTVQE